MGNKEQQHGICCVFGKDEYLTLLDALFNYKNFLDSKIAESIENEDLYSVDFYTDKDNKARALYNYLESFISMLQKHDCI